MKNEKSMDAGSQEVPSLISLATFSQLMGISKRSLQRLLTQGKLPTPVRLGRCLRWVRKEVDAWIAAKCPDLSRVQKVRGA